MTSPCLGEPPVPPRGYRPFTGPYPLAPPADDLYGALQGLGPPSVQRLQRQGPCVSFTSRRSRAANRLLVHAHGDRAWVAYRPSLVVRLVAWLFAIIELFTPSGFSEEDVESVGLDHARTVLGAVGARLEM